ncbi:hypothetical protein [Streptomyces avermitilis]|uniref:hypothetical protein n=1 Tax=Streptomyces avermitilis TaxID=33903 RepID=UPI003F4D12A6
MSRFPTPEHLVSWAKLCPRVGVRPNVHQSVRIKAHNDARLRGRALARCLAHFQCASPSATSRVMSA